MPVTNKNLPLINRKEPQFMSPAPTNTVAGAFIIGDTVGLNEYALYVTTTTTHWLYNAYEDGWVQIPSGGLGGTFGAGACGARSRWSATITANGGSTTTATTSAAINGLAKGKTIRFLTGLNAGLETTVTDVIIVPSGTNTLVFSALPNAVANTDTFIVSTGRFFVFNAGTLSATSYRVYDVLQSTWTSLSVTGLPASWATDGTLITTPSDDIIVSGTATSATINTLSNSGKTWTTNQWTNYQIRITSGTGRGQVRTISSNTGTQITVSSNWSLTPDSSSVYAIEGNDDFIYLIGNGAITMYRYSISGNSWVTLSPSVARTGAPSAGQSGEWVGKSTIYGWDNENSILDGRFIYSFRGGSGTLLDRYDIALNTWLAVTYNNATETFESGSFYTYMDGYIYIRKGGTNRMFKYNISQNYLEPLTTTFIPEGGVVIGDKMWAVKYVEGGQVKLRWLYYLAHTSTLLNRILVY
jgi:hypothetical protein